MTSNPEKYRRCDRFVCNSNLVGFAVRTVFEPGVRGAKVRTEAEKISEEIHSLALRACIFRPRRAWEYKHEARASEFVLRLTADPTKRSSIVKLPKREASHGAPPQADYGKSSHAFPRRSMSGSSCFSQSRRSVACKGISSAVTFSRVAASISPRDFRKRSHAGIA